jgi:O-methyltransferase
MSVGPDPKIAAADERAALLYLDLLKRCLTREIFHDRTRVFVNYRRGRLWRLATTPTRLLKGYRPQGVLRETDHDARLRAQGRDYPAEAETMIGLARLENIQKCITSVIRDGVAGDLIETGVWRGGATIFMRAVLQAFGETSRTVWVADSFEGLPKPDAEYPQDVHDQLWTWGELAIPLEQVQANFARYGLLDDQVRFLKGWFKETLPDAPIQRLAVMRLDGDMYESTTDALEALYPRLSPGGFVIVDDYGCIPACQAATEDFRAREAITDPIQEIDWSGVYWRRSA